MKEERQRFEVQNDKNTEITRKTTKHNQNVQIRCTYCNNNTQNGTDFCLVQWDMKTRNWPEMKHTKSQINCCHSTDCTCMRWNTPDETYAD